MGVLKDIFNKMVQDNESIPDKQPEQVMPNRYNKVWLDKTADVHSLMISDNNKRVDNILKKLGERDGHCPCGGMTDEFICPCRMMRMFGRCKCGLFEDAIDVDIKLSDTNGRVKS